MILSPDLSVSEGEIGIPISEWIELVRVGEVGCQNEVNQSYLLARSLPTILSFSNNSTQTLIRY